MSGDELRDLKDKNSELALEVQNLRILAAQKDKEKLELTKEINELRLKLSRLRSGNAAQARKLDANLQASSEEALSHIVQASGAIARTVEICKKYIQERQELDQTSPSWNYVPPSAGKKVNEVPPLMLGGQSIQPVVSLSRTLLNNRSIHRSPNQNSGVTQRALPIHMLQDVYIPLTRIDLADFQQNELDADENEQEESNTLEDLGLEDSTEQQVEPELDESNNLSSIGELNESRRLDAVIEESFEEETETIPPTRQQSVPNAATADNPLEGPSWLLDVAVSRDPPGDRVANRSNLEPDSTTPCETPNRPLAHTDNEEDEKENALCVSLAFTPTVRRRKRASSPPPHSPLSPHPPHPPRPPRPRKHSTGRVLKVVVAKMRLSDEPRASAPRALTPCGDSSPPKRAARDRSSVDRRSLLDGFIDRGSAGDGPGGGGVSPAVGARSPRDAEPYALSFDAPSPNGATDSGVIVCETPTSVNQTHSDSVVLGRSARGSSSRTRVDSGSDRSSSGEPDPRTRRPRRQVSYKEKPLNRKLRR